MKWWEVAVVIIGALQLLAYGLVGGWAMVYAVRYWRKRSRDHRRFVQQWTEMRKRQPPQAPVPHESRMRVADNGRAYLEREE